MERATAGADHLAKLGEARRLSEQLAAVREHLIGHYVDSARRSGASWSQIGGVLGVTKQSAQTRYQPYGSAPELVAVTTRLTGRVRAALDRAAARTAGAGRTSIEPRDLLDGVLEDPDALACNVLHAVGIRLRPRSAPASGVPEPGDVSLGQGTGDALNLAMREALGLAHNYIGTEHVLLGLALLPEARLGRALSTRGLDVDDLRRVALQRLAAGPSAPPRPRRRRNRSGSP